MGDVPLAHTAAYCGMLRQKRRSKQVCFEALRQGVAVGENEQSLPPGAAASWNDVDNVDQEEQTTSKSTDVIVVTSPVSVYNDRVERMHRQHYQLSSVSSILLTLLSASSRSALSTNIS